MPSPVSNALAALALTRPAYEEARAMYDGDVQEVIAAPRLADILAGNGSTYCVNYARTPVDVLVERTMIQGWTGKDRAALAGIQQAWDDNELGLEAKDVHRQAYEYGDAYLIGWRDDELPGRVSVYTHGPSDVRVFYDPARPRRKSHAVHTWLEVGDRGDEGNGLGVGTWRRVNLYYPDHLERYVSRYAVIDGTGQAVERLSPDDEDWRDFDDDGDDSMIVYADEGMPDVVPVFHFRTGRPYGRPEHADAFGPQRGINKLVVSMMGAVDYHILPQRYALTASALSGAPGVEVDPFAGTPDAEPGGTDGLADADLESGPGGVWLLSGDKLEVGQFAAALMSNFLEPKNDLVESMAAVTDLPLDRFRATGGQAISGESKRMSEIPLNKKTSDRFAQFGVTWREWSAWVLAVQASAAAPVPVDVQVAWAPPETYSDQASWATAKLQLEAGVPYEQVLRERGYSAELVAQWAATAFQRVGLATAGAAPGQATEDSDVGA
jgi:hypothetical protein